MLCSDKWQEAAASDAIRTNLALETNILLIERDADDGNLWAFLWMEILHICNEIN